MKVKELIAELSKYDENLEVGHINWEFYPEYDVIEHVEVLSVHCYTGTKEETGDFIGLS